MQCALCYLNVCFVCLHLGFQKCACRSVCLSIGVPVDRRARLSACPSVGVPVSQSLCLSVSLSISVSVYQCVCLISVSVCRFKECWFPFLILFFVFICSNGSPCNRGENYTHSNTDVNWWDFIYYINTLLFSCVYM